MNELEHNSMDEKPEYIATFRAPEDPTDEDGIRRLRHTLKALLRRFGWRCVTIRPGRDRPEPAGDGEATE